MSTLLKYFVIYPLLFVVEILDIFVGLFVHNPFKNLPKKPPFSILVDKTEPNSYTYRSVLSKELFKITDPKANIYQEFLESVGKYTNLNILGVREVISVEDQIQENGKVFKKFNLENEYKWISYTQVLNQVDCLANGLLKLGLRSNDNVVIFSETRREWLISALACFKIKVPLVTLYATLGIEALCYGVNQTNASFIIASGESVLKLEKIIDKIPNIKCIIVLTDKITEKNAINLRTRAKNLLIYTYQEVLSIGKESQIINYYESPSKDDLAIIMYTSGSTGNPKGVMITHGNILVTIKSIMIRVGELSKNDTYIAYLPLAHVLELMCELIMILNGIPIGYSSPFTLADISTAIKQGQLGDLRILKPSIITCVPTVLERLSKGVKEKLSKEESVFKKLLVDLAMKKKLKKFQAGKSTVLLDKLVFNKINQLVVGGRLRAVISAGALLNREVHEFGQTCFSRVIQIYGLTETCGGATTMFGFESVTEQVGSVINCCELKLVDWPEGNYRCTDKPNPRGEIWIGGDNISMGYYKLPDKTNEDYFYIKGIRYFATGDIGEMLPNGNIKIIDRKKDLVKLQGGEYVSLNKVECVVKLLPFVDNCCVIADAKKSYCVCLISPNVRKIQEFLSTSLIELETGKEMTRRGSLELVGEFVETLDRNEKLRNKFNNDIIEHCAKQGLERFEIPLKSKFVKEAWLPDTGLVTDSLKLKRKEIEIFYKKQIDEIYF